MGRTKAASTARARGEAATGKGSGKAGRSKPAPVSPPAPSRRNEASGLRRQAILDAALDVFSASGFAAARLDDVARRAGVAKGTIYLSFKDKEDLFEQMVLGAAEPVLSRANAIAEAPGASLADLLDKLFALFRSEVLATRRKDIALLVISEGARFPRIAAFYHREIVGRMLALVRGLAKRGLDAGELRSAGIVDFPQLVVAPMIMSLIWQHLFAKSEPLDVEGLLAAHRALLTNPAPPKRRNRRPS